MATVDVYRVTDKLEDAALDAIATRLEARGKHPHFQRMLDEYLAAMAVDGAAKVLDIGCGTGVVARRIAERPGFAGHVTGIDRSPRLIEAAEALASESRLSERIDYQVGDTHSLALPDGRFDAVVAHTLLSHVDDPLEVLREAKRVTKPGGVIAVFDGDFASATFAQESAEQGRRDDAAIVAGIVTNPRVMRQMPLLIRQAGLELAAFFPYVLAEAGTADFWLPAIESFRKLLPIAGTMTTAEASRWADSMLEASRLGTFFGACNYYAYVLKRSASAR